MKYPFVHDELEVKQNFLNSAREFAADPEAEKQFAAALLYANLTDYLATHLYESIKLAFHNATRTYYNGVLHSVVKNESDLPLGKVIGGLEEYSFPSRDLILPLLRKIKKNKDSIMHSLVKSPSKEMLAIAENAFTNLINDVEQLVVYVDDIYRSMPPKTILETFNMSNKAEDTNKPDVKSDKKGPDKIREKPRNRQ